MGKEGAIICLERKTCCGLELVGIGECKKMGAGEWESDGVDWDSFVKEGIV